MYALLYFIVGIVFVHANVPVVDYLSKEQIDFDHKDVWCQYYCTTTDRVRGVPHAKCSEVCNTSKRLLQEENAAYDLLKCNEDYAFKVENNRSANHFLVDFFDQFTQIYDISLNRMLDGEDVHIKCEEMNLSHSSSESATMATLVSVRKVAQRDCLGEVNAALGLDSWHPIVAENKQRWIASFDFSEIVASKVRNVECVEKVIHMPVIFKLAPLAKSTLTATMDTVPDLMVKMSYGDAGNAVKELNDKIRKRIGLVNALDKVVHREHGVMEDEKECYRMKPLSNSEYWTKALSVVLEDERTMWIDAMPKVTNFVLRGHEIPQIGTSLQSNNKSNAQMNNTTRKLDEGVHDIFRIQSALDTGIDGSGVVLGLSDTGLYMNHDQFDQNENDIYNNLQKNARKVVYYDTFADNVDQSEGGTCGHGTHVAAIAVGSSFSGNNPNMGVAPGAQIAFQDIGTQSPFCQGRSGCNVNLQTPVSASGLFSLRTAANAKVFSFSWGTTESDYSAQAQAIDDHLYKNQDIIVLVAAGNSGIKGESTISSPAGAKNVISVGASLNSVESFLSNGCPGALNPDSVAAFSSQGPTRDGRMKPDIVAPGQIISSASSLQAGSTIKTNARCDLQGTSQATPAAAGLAVLYYQWLRDGFWKSGVADPKYAMKSIPSSLVKALLIHSSTGLQRRINTMSLQCGAVTRSLTNLEYPDMSQGYGLPQFSNIGDMTAGSFSEKVYFLPNNTARMPVIDDKGVHEYNFSVTEGNTLRITLVWNDPAGSLFGRKMLQHDLDLTVKVAGGSGKTFYPLSGKGSFDRLNNVEVIQVDYAALAMAAGTNASGALFVIAKIHGFSVGGGSQSYSLVASSSSIASKQLAGVTSDSFWQPWMTFAAIGTFGAVVALIIFSSFKNRPDRAPQQYAYPASTEYVMPHQNQYVPMPERFSAPGYATQQQRYAVPGRSTVAHPAAGDQCPYCRFQTTDPVILVNHVVGMHPVQQQV